MEDSGKADGELTNPCAHVMHAQYASRCYHCDNKKDWEKEEEIKENCRKIKEIVPRRFLRWKKVFGKVESERMLTRKTWDHAIDLKKTFKP